MQLIDQFMDAVTRTQSFLVDLELLVNIEHIELNKPALIK